MSEKKFTRKQAIKLITPVVDDEVDENTRISFFNYLEKDDKVRSQYESVKRLKEMVETRCPCAKAPDSLKERIQNFINQRKEGVVDEHGDPIYDMPVEHTVTSNSASPPVTKNKNIWNYAAAASLLVIAVITAIYLYVRPFTSGQYNVEEYTYAHFTKHNGKLVQPTIATASPANAELELEYGFNMPVTVPPLKNAEFKGVVLNDFVPGFKTPLMEYYLPAEDQYIYIFAFKIPQLLQFDELSRSQEAVDKCIKSKDFHIRDINGKHVVSWKWEDTWYAAISNHDGETLASLVEPLQYQKND